MRILSFISALIMSAYQPVMAAVTYSCQVLNPMNKASQVLSKVIVKNQDSSSNASVTVVSSQSGSADVQITTSQGRIDSDTSSMRFFGKNQNSITQMKVINGQGELVVDQTSYKINCN